MVHKKYCLGIVIFSFLVLNLFFVSAVDVYAPNVSLVSPLNNALNKTSQVFSCNLSDDVQVANLTLFIWNSSGSIINQSNASLTGVGNSSNWTISFLSDGNYTWNCLGMDNSSNQSWSLQGNYTFVYDTTAPNFSISNQTSIVNKSFGYLLSATDVNGVSSFKLNNYTDVFSINSSNYIVNITQLNTTKEYYVNISVNDSLGNTNYTILLVNVTNDTTAPSIGSLDPYAGKTTDSSFSFSFIVHDDSPTACNITLDGSLLNSFSSSAVDITGNAITYSSGSLTPGSSHSWYVNCTDSFGNNGSAGPLSFTVSSTAASDSGSNSGASDAVIYYPTDSELSQRYAKNLRVSDGFSFKVKSISYQIILRSIGDNQSNFTIGSSTYVLDLGDPKKIDVNNDSIYDLQVIYGPLSSTRISVSVQSIVEAVPVVNTSLNLTNSSNLTENSSASLLSADSQNTETSHWYSFFTDTSWFSSRNIYYGAIGLVVLIIIVILIIIVRGVMSKGESLKFNHGNWKV